MAYLNGFLFRYMYNVLYFFMNLISFLTFAIIKFFLIVVFLFINFWYL